MTRRPPLALAARPRPCALSTLASVTAVWLAACGNPAPAGPDAAGNGDGAVTAPDRVVPGGPDGAPPADGAQQPADAGPPGDGGTPPADAVTPPPDARPADAGREYSMDRGTFFGSPRCGTAGVQLCDDFESVATGSPPDPRVWTVRTWGMGSAVVDTMHAARGTRAVHIHTPAVPASVTFTERRTFPAAGNTFYGRMFLYIDRIPRPFMWMDTTRYPLVHWTAAAASGPFMSGGMTYRPEVRAIGGINTRLLLNVDGGGRPEQGIDDMPPAVHSSIVEREWMCFEFEYRGSGATAEMRVWWDGIEHPRLHLSPTNLGSTGMAWPIPVYESLSFGWTIYQNYAAIMPAGFDVWIDEVAVDSSRIGCSL